MNFISLILVRLLLLNHKNLKIKNTFVISNLPKKYVYLCWMVNFVERTKAKIHPSADRYINCPPSSINQHTCIFTKLIAIYDHQWRTFFRRENRSEKKSDSRLKLESIRMHAYWPISDRRAAGHRIVIAQTRHFPPRHTCVTSCFLKARSSEIFSVAKNIRSLIFSFVITYINTD